MFTVEEAQGKEALLVFSFEEEALLCLRMEALGPSWRTRETTVGELASMLLRPFAGAERIALDPLPGVLGKLPIGLVSLGRKDFVRYLVGERRTRVMAPSRNSLAAPAPARGFAKMEAKATGKRVRVASVP